MESLYRMSLQKLFCIFTRGRVKSWIIMTEYPFADLPFLPLFGALSIYIPLFRHFNIKASAKTGSIKSLEIYHICTFMLCIVIFPNKLSWNFYVLQYQLLAPSHLTLLFPSFMDLFLCWVCSVISNKIMCWYCSISLNFLTCWICVCSFYPHVLPSLYEIGGIAYFTWRIFPYITLREWG